jgi:hypothetical protein
MMAYTNQWGVHVKPKWATMAHLYIMQMIAYFNCIWQNANTFLHFLIIYTHRCEYILWPSTTSSFLTHFSNHLAPHMSTKSIITPRFARAPLPNSRIQIVLCKQ